MKQTPSAHYFNEISQALKQAGAHRPTLVIDKQRLDQNLSSLMKVIQTGFDYRIVAKSLPSIPLLKYIMKQSGSNRLMSFHLPFLLHVVKNLPHTDILLGKPMTVSGARQFYQWQQHIQSTKEQGYEFQPEKQLHWLVDSLERLKQYQELAKELNCTLNINLELDIGLHRGGYVGNDKNNSELRQSLQLLLADKRLNLTGLMGYEAHASKIPSFLGGTPKAFSLAMEAYQSCIDQVVDVMGQDCLDSLILNAGGSSTYPLYNKKDQRTSFINEVATASALVKPTDFDVHTLDHHLPATFIAAPVLKLVKNPELPMASGLSKFMHKVGLLPKQACFIYGGNWLATPYFPENIKRANILGHSSNQEMYELRSDSSLKMDDYLYFRPSQSEAVFLQFGEIAVYEAGAIIDWWPIFDSESMNNLTEAHSTTKEIA